MISDISMEGSYYPSVNVGSGRIRLAGTDRGADELPRQAFLLQLPKQPVLLGEWRQRWAENGDDFDVEIVSFGHFPSEGLGLPTGRLEFTSEERVLAEDLVHSLFSNPLARQKHSAFRPERKGAFLGKVHFLAGWITERSRDQQ
jgi:hypothetical protein